MKENYKPNCSVLAHLCFQEYAMKLLLLFLIHLTISPIMCFGLSSEDREWLMAELRDTKQLNRSARPNILLLLADDLGYGDLGGIFGHPTSSTPNIDKLAKESKVFTNFYVAAVVCSPSRAALLTGKYPVSTGIYPGVFWPDSIGGLSPVRDETLAKKLLKVGYATAHVGKWHLGIGVDKEYLPTEHGFERYLGIPYSQDMCPCDICFPHNEPCIGCQDRSQYVSCPLIDDRLATKSNAKIISEKVKTGKVGSSTKYLGILQQPTNLTTLTDLYTEDALSFISSSLEEEKPFFLYMAYHQTHHPQFAGIQYRNQSDRGAFGDALEEMDGSVGRIVEFIKESNQANNTLIIFTSDNGPSLTRHNQGGCAGALRCGKGTTWEGGQRVPCFVSYANQIKPGKSHTLASSLDILPTIMSIVNGGVPANYKDGVESNTFVEENVGYDLSDHWFLEGKGPREVFLYYPNAPDKNLGPFAVRYKHYKAHFYTQGSSLSDNDNYDFECHGSNNPKKHDPPLLYDLNIDPGERHSLSPDSDIYRDVLPNLLEAKKNEEEKVGSWAPSEIDRGTSKEAVLCCNKDEGTKCQPYPKCCDCNFEGKPSYSTSDPIIELVEH